MPKFNTGGQTRNIYCKCGWNCRAQLREANSKYKLHKKVCEIAQKNDIENEAFTNDVSNGFDLGNGNRARLSNKYFLQKLETELEKS